MSSEKQVQANQNNGRKGRGPQSAPGKARSSRNATKTGMYSKLLLLPDENEKEFDRLRSALYAEWEPLGQTEINCVERLTACFWRERRLYRSETGLYCIYRQDSEGVGGVATAFDKAPAFDRLMKNDSAIEHSIEITLARLQQLQKERGKRTGLAQPPPAPNPPCPSI